MESLEKSPVVLVDILHDDNAQMLVRPELERPFTEKVLSQLTTSTKICVEGLNTGPQGIPPDHFNYDRVITRLWPSSSTLYKPTLYGADPRCRVSFAKNQHLMSEIDDILEILDNHLTITEEPQSIDEAVG